MSKTTCVWLLCLCSVLTTWAENRKINQEWSFHLGDLPSANLMDLEATDWETIQLPHDWAFERGYRVDGAQKDKGGYMSGGVGWYRKVIHLTEEERAASKLFLSFEAVYRNAEVWFNEHYLGKCAYGYLPFTYDVTDYVRPDRNQIAVRVDNSLEPSARWYHGCGIYGQVSLRSCSASYFVEHGTYVHTSNSQGVLAFSTDIQLLSSNNPVRLTARLLDWNGEELASEVSDAICISGPQQVRMKLNQPSLWSPEHPVLYSLQLQLLDVNGKVLDEQHLNVGFRDFAWSVEDGFFLNGKNYKLRGVCEHLEGGPTGAIYTPQLLRWKLKLLKEMGCNAIRTAHNPQLPMFYELCDEMGYLVMDEVFDGWKRKADYDYGMQAFSTSWEQDLRTIVRRDRNHPCVFLYSVGNETRGPMAADLVRVCHEEDSTRLVTSGTAGSEYMDVNGINGHSEDKKFLETFVPQGKPFIATENPHTWQVRGFYRTRTWYRDGYKPNQMMWIPDLTAQEIFTYDWIAPDQRRNRKQIFNSSYDNATVRVTARHILSALRDKKWFSGSFRWTGFDYLGEAGYVHGGWPFRAFQSGALDLAGFPKDLYYLYQSEWSTQDMVHILPHWSHPRMELGTPIPVWVYTTGDEVELFLNGRSLGRCPKGQSWDKIQCEFSVPWTPGTLEAVAYRRGKEIARATQHTAGAPCQLDISVENESLKADGEDISILTFRQEDQAGILYPYGENRIHVGIMGNARVLSFENGSPVDTTCNFNASSRCCFFGLNRAFIQSTGGDVEQPVAVVSGAICGDKQLQQSNLITIDCQTVVLRGHIPQQNIQIYYTTDGTNPTLESPLYSGAFPVEAGTTVKAVVYDGPQLLLSMEERFAKDEGLYWGKNGEMAATQGEQAEQLELKNCEICHDGNGAKGNAYVIPKPNQGILSWYQENDGGKTFAILTIRYAQQQAESSVMGLFNNNKLVETITFENTGSQHADWKEKQVKLIVYPGANQFMLKSMSKAGAPSIDQLDLK